MNVVECDAQYNYCGVQHIASRKLFDLIVVLWCMVLMKLLRRNLERISKSVLGV